VITVLTGPPCGGKSTYIRERAQQGDVIIDLDRIALALTVEGIPDHSAPEHVMQVAISARSGAIRRALRLGKVADVWIIHTAPKPQDMAAYRAVGATVLTIDPGMSVCLDRAAKLRPYAAAVIEQWYSGTLHRTRRIALGDSHDDPSDL